MIGELRLLRVKSLPHDTRPLTLYPKGKLPWEYEISAKKFELFIHGPDIYLALWENTFISHADHGGFEMNAGFYRLFHPQTDNFKIEFV